MNSRTRRRPPRSSCFEIEINSVLAILRTPKLLGGIRILFLASIVIAANCSNERCAIRPQMSEKNGSISGTNHDDHAGALGVALDGLPLAPLRTSQTAMIPSFNLGC